MGFVSTEGSSVSVLLSCSELENQWFISSHDRMKILEIVAKIKDGKISDKTTSIDALYKGFWINLIDIFIHVLEKEVTVFVNGIITFKYDKRETLQKYIYKIAPKDLLTKYVHMKIGPSRNVLYHTIQELPFKA